MNRPGIAELYSAIARPENLGSPSCTRPFLNPNKTTWKLFQKLFQLAIARPENLGSPSCTRPFLNPNKTTLKLFPEAISAFRFRYLFGARAGPGDGPADYLAVGGFHVAEGKNTRTVAVKLQTPGAPVVL
jgi:hypothetical protein